MVIALPIFRPLVFLSPRVFRKFKVGYISKRKQEKYDLLMVRKREKAYVNEFPVLDQLNLYASSTKGDGNCLFRALSDQLYGDESHHSEIRQAILDYVEANREHFAPFVGEFGETFDQYTSRLRQDGVYGGDIEITGFADRYRRSIVIYQADSLYVIEPRESKPINGSVHIAYHTWEHYSSVRKKGHPSGPAEIGMPKSNSISFTSESVTDTNEVPQWKIDIILKSIPDANEGNVVEMLRTKDTDTVIEELLIAQYENPDGVTTTDRENQTQDEHNSKPNEPPINSTNQHPTDDHSVTSTEKPEPNLNRREASRQRRMEKKERVRRKKTGKHASSIKSADEAHEPSVEQLSAKVMYI